MKTTMAISCEIIFQSLDTATLKKNEKESKSQVWKFQFQILIFTVHNNWVSTKPSLCSKLVLFNWSKMWVKMIENSPILQKMLLYVGYHSSRNLDPIFQVVLKIRAFEVRSFWFYLIKCPFFGNFDFESLYF